MTENAKAYCERLFGGEWQLHATDPEFAELFSNFAFDEVVNHENVKLDGKTRFIATLATLLGCQGEAAFREILSGALDFGVTPIEIKEILYQATAYLGLGRTRGFFDAVNSVFADRGIALPFEAQGTTTPETRFNAGLDIQVKYFGPQMKEAVSKAPDETKHINQWLADNCFGDYYTRKGFTDQQREMITFCVLAAQGGCEPQLTSHAVANIKLGNDKKFLIRVVSQCLPWIGYPRSLNALRCVADADKQVNEK